MSIAVNPSVAEGVGLSRFEWFQKFRGKQEGTFEKVKRLCGKGLENRRVLYWTGTCFAPSNGIMVLPPFERLSERL
jgi:hypothetical protein